MRSDADRRIPLHRKIAFALVLGLLSLGLLRLATALYARALTRPLDTEIPGPGQHLHTRCTLYGEAACGAAYGAALERCLAPACEAVGGFTTTPQGFIGPVDRVYVNPKPPDTLRILTLGGSTTGGWIADGLWPAKLERLLNEGARKAAKRAHVEVLNAAMQGASSDDSRRFLEGVGARFSPDVVILGEEVNDLGLCGAFHAILDSNTGRSSDELVQSYFEGRDPLASVASLSPWHARHVIAFEAERARRERRNLLGAASEVAVDPRALEDWKQGEDWKARCRRRDPPPREPPSSIFDDFEAGFDLTKDRYGSILTLAGMAGARTVVVSTTPHDFERFRCPTPGCATLLSVDDWWAYVVRVHNPGLRAFAHDRGVLLADLEVVVDDFGAGRNDVDADLSLVLGEFADSRALSPHDLSSLFGQGAIGKDPLFEEWMHPTPNGHELIAAAYFALLWPLLEKDLR